MFSSLSKTLLRRPLFLPTTLRLISTATAASNRTSFAFSYLVNSCGLSPESALFVSNRVTFETSARPDAVVNVFKSHGFSQSQISGIIRKWPPLILARPERTLLPKLKYLRSVGFSGSYLAQMITFAPCLLTRSLEKHLIPNFSRLRDFLGCDKSAVTAIRRSPRILLQGFEATVDRVVKILRDNGVRESSIMWLVKCHFRKLMKSHDHLKKIVEKTKGMGFDDPSAAKFAVAMLAVLGMSESMWERKLDAYSRWGWSKDDAMSAFVKRPWCMTLSEEKISAVMGFFVKEMGLESSFLLRHPTLMSLSLEKRICPRFRDPSYRGSSRIAGYISGEEAYGDGGTGSMKWHTIPHNSFVPLSFKLCQLQDRKTGLGHSLLHEQWPSIDTRSHRSHGSLGTLPQVIVANPGREPFAQIQLFVLLAFPTMIWPKSSLLFRCSEVEAIFSR